MPCAFSTSAFASSGLSRPRASFERRTRSRPARRSSTGRWSATGALVLVEVVGRDLVGVPAADRHRLVLDDDAQPAELGRRVERVEPAHVDLERALDGVLGVLGRRGPVLGDPQERAVMLADERRRPGAARPRPVAAGHRTHRQGTRLLRSLRAVNVTYMRSAEMSSPRRRCIGDETSAKSGKILAPDRGAEAGKVRRRTSEDAHRHRRARARLVGIRRLLAREDAEPVGPAGARGREAVPVPDAAAAAGPDGRERPPAGADARLDVDELAARRQVAAEQPAAEA